MQITKIPRIRVSDNDSLKSKYPEIATTIYPTLRKGYAKLTSTLLRTDIHKKILKA